ncbi:sensor histidine kinase [Mangrovimonas aestuarii]|uniref:sensor histidine kinase n=1 Tax=Mangrovimonas aestuarii TaxID=3018443 RepID=UPI0023791D61|nr:HAMP domain-containing sensor histidine kinase [Mangrovimonas aestuarii]
MELKTKRLIIGAIFTLVAFTVIQAFLIFNTYKLKRELSLVDARSAIQEIFRSSDMDSLFWINRNDFLYQLEEYRKGNITKQTLLSNFQEKSELLNKEITLLFQEKINRYNLGFDVNFKVVPDEINISNANANNPEQILNQSQGEIPFLGSDFSLDNAVLINNSSWTVLHEFENNGIPDNVFLKFHSKVYMKTDRWLATVIKELTGLFILFIFLYAFVVFLLFYSIHNLSKQKTLTDIKTDFINNITHELNTPLTTLSVAIKTLTDQSSQNNNDISEQAIAIINRQNIRLQSLVKQVTRNSVNYTQIKLKEETFNLSQFVSEIVDDYSLTLKDLNKDITLEKNIADTETFIVADKFYLETAIINLLNNAVKYGASKIKVSYKFDETSQKHHIVIVDNGIGIPKKDQKLVFEKFYKVSENNHHSYKGLGLGLYYTQQIIKAHFGSIELKSKKLAGSTFTITIPKK